MGIIIEEKKVESIEKIEANVDQLFDFFIIKYADVELNIIQKTVIYALGSKHRELSEICDVKDNVTYHH